MSDGSSIEWTDATWNPVRGCTKISPGCKHCYAETFAERFRDVPGHAYEHGFDFRLVPHKLNEPLMWSRSRRIFVNSMSDLFQQSVPSTYIDSVFAVMSRANWHSYQVLTKRSNRMQRLISSRDFRLEEKEHIWLGVSVEDRKFGLPRIAARVSLPFEPLLQPSGSYPLNHCSKTLDRWI
uniref:Bacteriophage protein gp37 n=1 Tax=uncultured bacterium A1Q1_fos_91 TaxID=1256591 RepID=L7VVX3_9BACT|nr:bacteriophage protein gp37 [uncultured bacterium A1Q1_fos_91]